LRFINTEVIDKLEGLALNDLDFKDLPPQGEFETAMHLCMNSISNNLGLGVLTGIRVEGNDVLSSDNFRATWVKLSVPLEPAFTIPGDSVADLLKLQDLEQYAITSAWAHFMSKSGAVFSSRLMAADFPSEGMKRMFPKSEEDSYKLPAGIEDALGRVGILAYTQDDGQDYVTISRDNGTLEIKGERQYGSAKEKIPATPEEWPEGVIVHVRPGAIIDIISRTRTFQKVGGLLFFHGNGFKHVISTIQK
jgi:DNA polymerase III sliding clamp (beta) subunit (PCNA family)